MVAGKLNYSCGADGHQTVLVEPMIVWVYEVLQYHGQIRESSFTSHARKEMMVVSIREVYRAYLPHHYIQGRTSDVGFDQE